VWLRRRPRLQRLPPLRGLLPPPFRFPPR
jgi:hypothetical protein